jgi:uncharacterized membrane protein YccF (DUF307 family)
MIRSLSAVWRLVMDPEVSPLMRIPKMQRFQMMQVLAFMWCIVFSMWLGSAMAFGFSAAVHSILLIGIFFTAEVFRRARRNSPAIAAGHVAG